MSYQVHNFQTGEVIEAAPVNEMDAQILLNETNISIAQQKTKTSNKTGSKMYLVGATSQSSSDTTYSNVNVYIGTDNCLYSNGEKVAVLNSPAFSGTPTAPTAVDGTHTTQVATTAFVMNAFKANDAMVFKGTIGTSGTVTSLPNTHYQGWTYKVITAGTYAGKVCEIGDMIICVNDGTTASNNDWTVVQSNIDGAVTGPSTATAEHVATYNGNTGKVIKDSGFTIGASVPADAEFTDTKVTSSANHYSPSTSSGANVSASASGGSELWGADVVKGITLNTDGKGHVTGASVTSGKIPANPIDNSADESTNNKTWSASKLIQELREKSGIIENSDTTEASSKSFFGGIEDDPFKLKIAVKYNFDKNGYDSVWPAGGGTNLLDESKSTDGYSINASGVITETSGFAYSDLIRVYNSIYQYSFWFKHNSSTRDNYRIHGYNANGVWVSQVAYKQVVSSGSNFIICNIPSNISYIRISYSKDRSSERRFIIGTTTKPWQPYENIGTITGHASVTVSTSGEDQQKEYNIQFPNPPGIVYDGELTINKDGSCILSVARELFSITNLDAEQYRGIHQNQYDITGFYINIPTSVGESGIGTDDVCTMLPVVHGTLNYECHADRSAPGMVYMYMPTALVGTTAQSIKSFFDAHPCYVTNEYNTPQIYNFTTEQVVAFLGSNTISTGVCDILQLDYNQDIKTYINDRMGTINALPSVTSEDNGKILQVVDGEWTLVTMPS